MLAVTLVLWAGMGISCRFAFRDEQVLLPTSKDQEREPKAAPANNLAAFLYGHNPMAG
jgi:hypothetical protein